MTTTSAIHGSKVNSVQAHVTQRSDVSWLHIILKDPKSTHEIMLFTSKEIMLDIAEKIIAAVSEIEVQP